MRSLRRLVAVRREQADDRGGALILVLVIGVLLIGTLGVAMAVTTSGLQFSTMFKTDSQSEMAAQTGLSTELTAMEQVSSYKDFPCSGSGTLAVSGAASSYSATVSYSAAGTALTCTGDGDTLGGNTVPTNATLTAVGKAAHATTVTMKQDAEIAVQQATPAEVGYAIYTSNNIVLDNDATLTTGTNAPDIYAGNQVTCKNGTSSMGSVTTYQPVDFSGTCTFDGSLTSAGYVKLQNSATIVGDVTSYGGDTAATSCDSSKSGGVTTYYAICLSGSTAIKGNATETNGNIEVPNGEIYGNAAASGSIVVSGGGVIAGTQTPNDSTLTSQTIPSPTAFPTLTLPSTGWNVVQIPNANFTCAQYFESIANEGNTTTTPYSISNPDPFQAALETQTTKTIYDAPSCDVSYANSQVFGLNPSGGDAILDVATLSFQNANIFCEESAESSGICSSATSPGPNLIMEANGPPPTPPATTYTCSTSTVDMSFSNESDFEPNVDVLLYTMGQLSYANQSGMTGQIQACGGVSTTNAFSLAFNPSAAEEVYGSPSGNITISILDKYVASG